MWVTGKKQNQIVIELPNFLLYIYSVCSIFLLDLIITVIIIIIIIINNNDNHDDDDDDNKNYFHLTQTSRAGIPSVAL